ncbi:MAG: hypothetical protein KGN84_01010, partial [Acidobacteriota bacterium]|nr:hypothetical protein [Acidobacteriota bacterium]
MVRLSPSGAPARLSPSGAPARLAFCPALLLLLAAAAQSAVTTARVPAGGIQPQVIERNGVIHLLYFKGDPAHGDLFYARSKDYGVTFSKPIQVNHIPGSAIAIGNIRGAQLAVGRNGRVHVAWNGTEPA